ncbi:MAG: hypothetical protein Q7T29_14600 [Gallionella sp.]|nr:hypothetical protein [Gallionella sp.]
MSRMTILSLVASVIPGVLHVRRSTWIAVGIGFLCVSGLLVWAAIALMGSLWGQAKNLAGAAPDAARVVIEQAERVIPGANQALEALRTATKPAPPPQDVSGIDPAQVTRYPGLVRTHWNRDGDEITVRYEGQADYTAVLNEYARDFARQGYGQHLLSASPNEERHDYVKKGDRIQFTIARSNKDTVKIVIVTSPLSAAR